MLQGSITQQDQPFLSSTSNKGGTFTSHHSTIKTKHKPKPPSGGTTTTTKMNYTELIKNNFTVRDAYILHKIVAGATKVHDLVDEEISAASVSQCTDKLFAKGYINRIPHITDRRRFQYSPTAKGVKLNNTKP